MFYPVGHRFKFKRNKFLLSAIYERCGVQKFYGSIDFTAGIDPVVGFNFVPVKYCVLSDDEKYFHLKYPANKGVIDMYDESTKSCGIWYGSYMLWVKMYLLEID